MNDETLEVSVETMETILEIDDGNIYQGDSGTVYFQSIIIVLVGLLALSAIRSAFSRMFWR